MTETITLDPWQFKCCAALAADRMATSNDAGWNNASTYERTYLKRLEEETVGACGEMAAAKALDIFFSPSVNTFHKTTDLPHNIEVRATNRDPNGRVSLIIRKNDPSDRIFVLVNGEPPVMHVLGWFIAEDAKKPEYLDNPNGHRESWFVPKDHLHPIAELKSWIAEKKIGVPS